MSGPGERAARWLATNGGTLQAASERFNISRQAAQQAWVKLFRLRPTPKQQKMLQMNAAVAKAVAAGRTPKEIMEALKIPRSRFDWICRELKLERVWLQAARQRRDATIAAVIGGACVADASAEFKISQAIINRELQARGIGSHATSRGRRDGRIARAVERVEGGMSVAEACRLERCASSGVYVILKRRRIQCAVDELAKSGGL